MRVITSECETTMEKKEITKIANLPVVHTHVQSKTANIYSKGDYIKSQEINDQWANYLEDNFQEEKYQKHQVAFAGKNARLNKALNHQTKKKRKVSVSMESEEDEPKMEVIHELGEEQSEVKKVEKPKSIKLQGKKRRRSRSRSVKKLARKGSFSSLEECDNKSVNSLVDSDEDQAEFMENMMGKQSYNLSED